MNRRAWIGVVTLAILAAGASAAAPTVVSYLKNFLVVYQPPYRAANLVAPIPACIVTTYTGADAPLYADRDYHTVKDVKPLMGLSYCRPIRHGNDIWVVTVTSRTTLYAIWPEDVRPHPGLWRDAGMEIEVSDEGAHTYRLKALDVDPGLHVINQSFSDPTMPVFWDGKSVSDHD